MMNSKLVVISSICSFCILVSSAMFFFTREKISEPEKIAENRKLDNQIRDKQNLIKTLDDQLKVLKDSTESIPESGSFYSLDKPIYLVRFRPDQKEIWIRRNNEVGNFSEELVNWLRNNDTFYVSEELIKYNNGKIEVSNDAYIFLPPCSKGLINNEQPTCFKSRFSVIKQVTKDEYEQKFRDF